MLFAINYTTIVLICRSEDWFRNSEQLIRGKTWCSRSYITDICQNPTDVRLLEFEWSCDSRTIKRESLPFMRRWLIFISGWWIIFIVLQIRLGLLHSFEEVCIFWSPIQFQCILTRHREGCQRRFVRISKLFRWLILRCIFQLWDEILDYWNPNKRLLIMCDLIFLFKNQNIAKLL